MFPSFGIVSRIVLLLDIHLRNGNLLKVNAERKRERGMHRWFTVSMSEDADLDVVAKTLAELDVVERVQFSNRVVAPKGSIRTRCSPG